MCCLGFSGCRVLAVGCVGSAAVVHGLSCSLAYGIFRTRDGTHVLLALAGRFFTREPPGKSCTSILKLTEWQCWALSYTACLPHPEAHVSVKTKDVPMRYWSFLVPLTQALDNSLVGSPLSPTAPFKSGSWWCVRVWVWRLTSWIPVPTQ